MSILLLLKAGDINRYTILSERLAREFAISGEWHFSESYWNVAQNWHRMAKDDSALKCSMIEAAECNISLAQEGLNGQQPQNAYAAHWMGRGLEGLRRAKANPARIAEVHRKFLSLQKEALSDLKPFDFDPESLPGLKENRDKVQETVTKHVSGLDFERAILRLALLGQPTDYESLKKNELENADHTIWDKICGANQLDGSGKVADVLAPIGFGEDVDETALRKKLVQTACMIYWPNAVEWRIDPARRAISEEHPIRTRDLAFLVTNNPFIPEGHEGIYLRGIQAGFFGDWLLAMHLLIPQIEASLRHVLQQYEVVSSTLESDGTQKERDINQLLWDETAEDVFGPDILFDLRGILIERFGSNMRNESAHGLMHEGAFYRGESVYLWWLVIRLCWIGFRSSPPTELP